METVICNECFISKTFPLCIKNICCCLCKYGFFIKMPYEESNRELSLNIIKAIGWNYKISTELRSESLAEITEVRCLLNFQS